MTAMPDGDPLHWIGEARGEEIDRLLASLDPAELREWRWHWALTARAAQLPPPGDWRVWLVMAGRGFGKTRCGAEWINGMAESDPRARIALVADNLGEARMVMVEGESGLLNVGAPWRRPAFEPSLRRLTWPNGAQATLYSAAEPEALRGPQHSHAWCDEIGKWPNSGGRAMACWNNLAMGLRLGTEARVLATTTPRSVPLVKRLIALCAEGEAVLTRGTTYDNAANLPFRFLREMRRAYGRSHLGRQEIEGELLTDFEGALWTRGMLESCREDEAARLARIVVGVDPPASARGNACGIVVAGRDEKGLAHVLADVSIARASPERWARAVARAAEVWQADRVVAEANQGGAMVASVLRAAHVALPLKLVHASRGKVARAEPVAALYEAGRVRHMGVFPELEDELCGLIAGGRYEGPGDSPDRADALVWALTELMLGRTGRPSIRLA